MLFIYSAQKNRFKREGDELYFTFSCFLFGCFVKNYGIKKEVHYKLLIMSKISSPYQSHFFGPNPFIARSSSIVVGL